MFQFRLQAWGGERRQHFGEKHLFHLCFRRESRNRRILQQK
nr:MAG TPA: hypothetical protein [Caudoviricetes sp.]DAP82206.1 MAG TPA: hypothetical protein [Caudoviricetes sp.]